MVVPVSRRKRVESLLIIDVILIWSQASYRSLSLVVTLSVFVWVDIEDISHDINSAGQRKSPHTDEKLVKIWSNHFCRDKPLLFTKSNNKQVYVLSVAYMCNNFKCDRHLLYVQNIYGNFFLIVMCPLSVLLMNVV